LPKDRLGDNMTLQAVEQEPQVLARVRVAPAFRAFRHAGRTLEMCHVFAGQDPADYTFETRSVRLIGHSTSVRLEARFWMVLEQLAEVQGMAMAKFLSALYKEALEIHGEVGNFASFLRCCCLNFLDPAFDHERLAKEAALTRTRLENANAA
jgi:predicted DNA-binding ribbon-helix-helix protein